MPETNLHQPGLSPLLAAAEAAELTQAAPGYGHQLADRDLLAPDTRTGADPATPAGVDRAIRVSTAVAVLAVAGVAAYVSYWHAYAVVRAHGETGVTARLEPATIDGLVYASSMVNLYAARHRLPVPSLARWLLALGIVATLAANMAQGWSDGPIGAVIAAWPAVSLVGSYELLVWIIRTAAAGDLVRGPAADHSGAQVDHYGTGLRLAAAQGPDAGPGNLIRHNSGLTPGPMDGPLPVPGMAGACHVGGPGWNAAGQVDQVPGSLRSVIAIGSDVNAAAAAAYRASIQAGKPLSERKLAEQFGKTSRRWARNRMAEAQQSPSTGLTNKKDGPSLRAGVIILPEDLGPPARTSPSMMKRSRTSARSAAGNGRTIPEMSRSRAVDGHLGRVLPECPQFP
jgi:hypothetical protein